MASQKMSMAVVIGILHRTSEPLFADKADSSHSQTPSNTVFLHFRWLIRLSLATVRSLRSSWWILIDELFPRLMFPRREKTGGAEKQEAVGQVLSRLPRELQDIVQSDTNPLMTMQEAKDYRLELMKEHGAQL